jgi:pyrroline-5-carboxylate reductase
MRDSLRGKTVISLVGGVKVERLEEMLYGENRFLHHCGGSETTTFIRAMPNIAAEVCRSITILELPSPNSDDDDDAAACSRGKLEKIARAIFLHVGAVMVLPEELSMDEATAVGSSGVGLFACVLKEMVEGMGGGAGALEVAAQAMRGAAELVLEGGREPEVIMGMVATRGGSTERGLGVLRGKGTMAEAVGETVRATREFGGATAEEKEKGGAGAWNGA